MTTCIRLFPRPRPRPLIAQKGFDRRCRLLKTTAALWTVIALVVLISELAAAGTAMPDAIMVALDQARRDLEIYTALETRAADQLAVLRQIRPDDADMLGDYESYLKHLQALVAENRSLVAQLQSLRDGHPPAENATPAGSHQTAVDAPIPETTLSDDVDHLDRELNASLAEFDEMLRKELDRIRQQSTPKMDALAQEAAEAAERLREKGIDIGTGQSASASDTEANQQPSDSEQTDTAMSSGAAGQDRDSEKSATTTGQAAEGVEGDRQRQAERYDGSDDDIVARQLREAAEQETDPELKEKLWREYEAYKRGVQ